MFNKCCTILLTSLMPRSAKFWFLLCGSLVRLFIPSVPKISSIFRLIWAFALSLIRVSIAPYLRICFFKASWKSALLFPNGSMATNPDFRPMKNCAAVDPVRMSAHGPYMVSVATSSFRLRMFRAGLGALNRRHSLLPSTAASLPSCVVFLKVSR